MMTDIHSCSYYCDRPACVKAQRDELRDKLFGEDLEESEPFGWLYKQVDGNLYKLLRGEDAEWSDKNNPHWVKVSPLYTAPPKREWIGLTKEEFYEIVNKKWWDWEDTFDIEGFARAVEVKLKEKNHG